MGLRMQQNRCNQDLDFQFKIEWNCEQIDEIYSFFFVRKNVLLLFVRITSSLHIPRYNCRTYLLEWASNAKTCGLATDNEASKQACIAFAFTYSDDAVKEINCIEQNEEKKNHTAAAATINKLLMHTTK